jgi:hypothetical protein
MGWTNQVVQASEVIIAGAPDAFYMYNGAEGPNQLVLSAVSGATVDSYGNQVPANLTIYDAQFPGAATNFSDGNYTYLVNADGLSSQQGAWQVANSFFQNASIFFSTSPFATEEQTGTPAVISNAAIFYANANGTPATVNAQGLAGAVPAVQQAIANFSNPNNGTQPITSAWSIPANAPAGSSYEIWVPFSAATATAGPQSLGLKPYLNAAVVTTSGGDVIGGTAIAAATGFTGDLRCTLVVTATGAAGTADIYIKGGYTTFGANIQATGSSNYISSQATGVALNTTVANTIAVAAVWGASSAGQTIATVLSRFTRKGP